MSRDCPEICLPGYDGDDLDGDSYSEEMICAKVSRKCYECNETIPAGERHERAGGRYEGIRKHWYFCAACSEISKAFSCDGSRLFGTLWEAMDEHAFADLTTANPCFRKLSGMAKRFLMERWNGWREENL